jgi:predicted nuclease of predicted toxin-antitoxin system
MIIWINAHLSPSLAAWINRTYPAIQAKSLSSLNLQRADDRTIFELARKEGAVIMSKDADFLKPVELARNTTSDTLD